MADELLTVRGIDKVNAELKALVERFGRAVGPALVAEAEIEMTEAKRRTPVAIPAWYLAQGYGRYIGSPGSLRASGHVVVLKNEGGVHTVGLVFGGPSAPYALYVHENMEAFHPNGQAQFLASTLMESVPYLSERIARRIERSL